LQVFPEESKLLVFEKNPDKRTSDKQEVHTVDATQVVEHQLKSVLQGLALALFGPSKETEMMKLKSHLFIGN